MRAYNFESRRSSPTKLYHVTCRQVGVITRVQFLRAPPVKFKRAKNVKNSVRFQFGTRDFETKEITTPQIFHNLTFGAGRTHVGLCPKFLVFS